MAAAAAKTKKKKKKKDLLKSLKEKKQAQAQAKVKTKKKKSQAKPTPKLRGLNEKQKRFCLEYLKDLNGTQAAIRAGYSKGANSDVAGSCAGMLLQRPHIQAFLSKQIAKRNARTEVTAERVVLELARLAFVDLRNFLTFDNTGVRLKSSSEISPDDAATLKEISQGPNGIKVKLFSKERALDLLARHTGVIDTTLGDMDPTELARKALPPSSNVTPSRSSIRWGQRLP